MPHCKGPVLPLIGALAALTGCSTPSHTDLLVFGTNTQFGVSVSAEATANPGVNIGFRRQELVLMPLYVNGQDSKATLPSADSPKYQGTDGQQGGKADTYSVLASFGATGSGAASGDAKVGIAQYFATGLAARTLAVAGGMLVNTGKEAAEASKETAVQAVKTDPGVTSLKEAGSRFASEAAVSKGFKELPAEKKTALLAKLNAMFAPIGGAALTEANFEQSLQAMNDDQLSYTQDQFPKS